MTYKTAYRWWKAGKLDAYPMDTGTVIVRDPLKVRATNVALDVRVSSVDQRNDLERQLERLKDYAAAQGYQVTRMVSEIGSGLNDRRPKSLKLLQIPRLA
ncbi:MAG: recombinase family protein [Ktedonobacteraceae bacterium]